MDTRRLFNLWPLLSYIPPGAFARSCWGTEGGSSSAPWAGCGRGLSALPVIQYGQEVEYGESVALYFGEAYHCRADNYRKRNSQERNESLSDIPTLTLVSGDIWLIKYYYYSFFNAEYYSLYHEIASLHPEFKLACGLRKGRVAYSPYLHCQVVTQVSSCIWKGVDSAGYVWLRVPQRKHANSLRPPQSVVTGRAV